MIDIERALSDPNLPYAVTRSLSRTMMRVPRLALALPLPPLSYVRSQRVHHALVVAGTELHPHSILLRHFDLLFNDDLESGNPIRRVSARSAYPQGGSKTASHEKNMQHERHLSKGAGTWRLSRSPPTA